MQDRHVDELVAAYMLGALEPDEVDDVERHLEGCERCRALIDEARATRDALLLAAPPATPPPALRARVLARIAEEATASRQPRPQAREAAPRAEPRQATPNAIQRFIRSMLGPEETDERHAERLIHELLADPESAVWQVGGTEQA